MEISSILKGEVINYNGLSNTQMCQNPAESFLKLYSPNQWCSVDEEVVHKDNQYNKYDDNNKHSVLFMELTNPDVQACALDSWYNALKEFTPKTYCMDVSKQESQAIIAFFRYANNNKDTMTKKHSQILRQLQEKIQNLYDRYFKGVGTFPRFSQKSLKDGISRRILDIDSEMEKRYKEIEKDFPVEKWGDVDREKLQANIRMCALTDIDLLMMKCESAQDIMNLILTSVRTYQDLTVMVEYSEMNSEYLWNYKLCMRQFEPEMKIYNEYRCFVFKNRMNAITKHRIALVTSQLDNEFLENLKHKIYSFWNNNIRQKVENIENYSIDFALYPDGGLHLVEVNPFFSSDSFSFDPDEDMEILEGKNFDPIRNEEEQIVMRVYQELPDDIIEKSKEHLEEYKAEIYNYEEILDEFDPPSGYCIIC